MLNVYCYRYFTIYRFLLLSLTLAIKPWDILAVLSRKF